MASESIVPDMQCRGVLLKKKASANGWLITIYLKQCEQCRISSTLREHPDMLICKQ